MIIIYMADGAYQNKHSTFCAHFSLNFMNTMETIHIVYIEVFFYFPYRSEIYVSENNEEED